jgi:hypothetical protein
MRLGWRIPLPGPFYLGGTIWRSRRHSRRPFYTGTLPDGWRCPHRHTREDKAIECRDKELRRRRRTP